MIFQESVYPFRFCDQFSGREYRDREPATDSGAPAALLRRQKMFTELTAAGPSVVVAVVIRATCPGMSFLSSPQPDYLACLS